MMRLRGTPESWIAALTGPNERAWKHATLTMGGLEPEHAVDPAPFARALDSASEEVVFWSVTALARLRHRARPAVPRLIAIAGHRALAVRQAVIAALVRIAPADPAVKRAVFTRLRDRSPFVRSDALRAVVDLRGLTRADLGKVRRRLRDRNADVRDDAHATIDNIKRRKALR
jgi:hypothetical protein